MQMDDTLNYPCNLGVIERWAAARPVPGQQQLKGDLWIDAVPKKVAGKRSNRRVPLSFRNTFAHQLAPIIERTLWA
jgi:hypothetical protein